MKANEFLKLVGLMMTAQADYFAISKKHGSRSGEAIAALVKSKDLEKQVRAVVKEGVLEPDEPQPTVHIYTTAQYQEQLDLMERMSDEQTLAEYLKPKPDDQT